MTSTNASIQQTLPMDDYLRAETISFYLRDRAMELWREGRKDEAFVLYQADPLGGFATREVWEAGMARMAALPVE